MKVRHFAGSVALATALAMGTALAGCAPATIPPTALGTVVIVTENEYSIVLAPTQHRPGTYTFEVHNDGGATHNLHITGPGVGDVETPNIAPDGTASLTVTLESGEYEFYCATQDHKAAGMDATITVR